jgi:hypothetical protein
MNPRARPLWQHYLCGEFEHWRLETAPDLWMIRLINKLRHFGGRAWYSDLGHMEHQIHRILADYSYFLSIAFTPLAQSGDGR